MNSKSNVLFKTIKLNFHLEIEVNQYDETVFTAQSFSGNVKHLLDFIEEKLLIVSIGYFGHSINICIFKFTIKIRFTLKKSISCEYSLICLPL